MNEAKKPGRPLTGETKMMPRTVKLDDATVERGRALGGGNLSLGIRRALAISPRPDAAPVSQSSPDSSPPGSVQPAI